MAGRYRYSRRRKVYRKRRVVYRRKRTIYNKVKKVVNNIAERKFYQLGNGTGGAMTAWPNIAAANFLDMGLNFLYPIQQGTTQSTRLGRSIRLAGIDVCVCIQTGTTFNANLPLGTIATLAFVEDKQTNGTTIVPANVFDTAASMPGCHLMRNQLYLGRYVVHDVQSVTLSNDMKGMAHVRFRYFAKNKLIWYAGNAGTISDIVKSNFYVIGALGTNITAGSDVVWNYSFQTKFTDA